MAKGNHSWEFHSLMRNKISFNWNESQSDPPKMFPIEIDTVR